MSKDSEYRRSDRLEDRLMLEGTTNNYLFRLLAKANVGVMSSDYANAILIELSIRGFTIDEIKKMAGGFVR